MEKLKVCVVVDNEAYRNRVVNEINASNLFTCVGKYELVSEALFDIPSVVPHILLMDLDLKQSKVNGSVCMLTIKIINQSFKVVVITSFKEDNAVFDTLEIEHNAYQIIRNKPNDVVDILKECINQKYFPNSSNHNGLEHPNHQPLNDINHLQNLSKREMEILKLLSMGFLNKEISDQLNISNNTVKGVIYNIYKKLQVKNRVEAANKYKLSEAIN